MHSERGSWTADVGMRGNHDMQEIIDTGAKVYLHAANEVIE